jgi:hypothetical protein
MMAWRNSRGSFWVHYVSPREARSDKNIVLACVCEIGYRIDPVDLQEWIQEWNPLRWAGEMIQTEDRADFMDHYHANVAGFIDFFVPI